MLGAEDLDLQDVRFHADVTLERLRPRLAAVWKDMKVSAAKKEAFESRLREHWPALFALLYGLYRSRYDFFHHVEQILRTAAIAWAERPDELCARDQRRGDEPEWFQTEKIVGGALYVDLFSGTLRQARNHIGYLKDLGLTYIHLMPLFATPPGDSDGGYAVSNYRAIDPRLGTIDDLRTLARDLREAGIHLALDFVCNHTADDHAWARRARAGQREFQDYYYLFSDRATPERYQRTLREIFPTVRRGNFTWHEGMKRWVWTTFNSFQWDLNYRNPAVFRAMLEEMLFLANVGVDVLRFDALAFIWKRMGTSCENLPEAHAVIRAFNRLARLAAPGLIFKSEAIVHPDEVIKYVSPEECQISYNPNLMALLWESLATRKVELLVHTLRNRFRLPEDTAWVNYVRCHDDIGWTFDDQDAAAIGINAPDHRRFLNDYYTGRFPFSFARGVSFQENHETGDMRISGTLASLAGLEQALQEKDDEKKELAIRRIMLLYGVILSIGGIPLLYLGDEWAMLNDYDSATDPAKSGDSRWVHRPKMQWDLLEERDAAAGAGDRALRGRVFRTIRRLITLRKSRAAFAGVTTEVVDTENEHVLGYLRLHAGNRLTVLANFSEQTQSVPGNVLRNAGLGYVFEDVIQGETYLASKPIITLEPYRILWLERPSD